MRTILLVLCLLLLCSELFAQEYVVNGGFETVTECPLEPGDLYLATGWRAVEGTPDLLHACAETRVPGRDVLSNFAGYRKAVAGQGRAGLCVLYHNRSMSAKEGYQSTEALYTRLNQPLLLGRMYRVSFYVSRADSSSLAADSLYVVLSGQWPTRPTSLQTGRGLVRGVWVDNRDTTWQRVQVDVSPREPLAYLAIGLPRAKIPFSTYKNLVAQGLQSNQLLRGISLIGYYYLDQVSVLELGSK